jgi:DNA ligase (NAD+)
VGEENAILLANTFKTLAALRAASAETLSNVDGVGPIIGRSVADWFADKSNKAMLERLLKHVHIQKVIPPKKGVLSGQTVVVTGTLPTLSREEAEALVRKAGGKPASSVSNKTSFLLAGENAGSKLEKAKSLNIRVISEAQFLSLTK